MNPRDELVAEIMTLTDDEVNQVIALAIMAGVLKEEMV